MNAVTEINSRKRTKELEETNRRLEQDLLHKHEIETQLAQAKHDLRKLKRELSTVREQVLNEFHERKQIDLILRTQTEELVRSNRELEQFASLAAHDLQEPLHSIRVFLDIFRVKYGSTFDEIGEGYLNRVTKAASRMQQLIHGLLTYSRVDSQTVATESIDLTQLVKDILSDFEARIQESDAVIEVDQMPTIQGCPLSVRQIFHNIISNALKFHKAGIPPIVKISGKILQDRRHTDSNTPGLLCQVEIQDQGIGIPQEQVHKVFGMFKRLHQRDEYEGAGIGLAICQRIVNRLGGTIVVQSRLGKGSTFRVTLPTQA